MSSKSGSALLARLDDQLELGCRCGELEQLGARLRVDRDDPLDVATRGPGEQLAGEEAVLGADLDYRSGPGRLQACEDELSEVRQRAVEAVEAF